MQKFHFLGKEKKKKEKEEGISTKPKVLNLTLLCAATYLPRGIPGRELTKVVNQ